MDLLSSMLAYISLNLISGSVWQISRGGVIITTAIFSRIFLSKKLTKAAIVGCSLTFIGITLVQVFEVLLSSEKESSSGDSSTSLKLLGIVLLLISLVFNTITFISEKMIFNKYSIHPLKMVFLEGFYALGGIIIVIGVLSYI